MITEKVAGYQLLCHNQLATGMAIPPGEGFADFFAALAEKPVSVDALHKTFDDHQLIDAILVALCQHGYLSLSASQAAGDTELDQLRQGAEIKRQKQLCQRITLNADNVSIEEICLMLEAESIPPVLHLVCASLAKAAPLLSELAKRRQAGKVVIHNAIVETYVIGASSPVLKSLRGLNAGVIISGVSWPLPQQPLKEIDVLTRAGVPVYAHMKPGRSFLDDKTRSTVMVWARSNHISGLVLDLYVNELWPGGDASTGDFKDVFAALAEMEAILGDVRVSNLPDDQVLLGKAALSCPQPMTDLEWNFRKAYLHWRLPILKGSEGDNTFSQTPEAEEKLIPFHRDLLPNHPELLNIRAGSLVVDFAGGNGRVARRLSPLVGKDGLIISVEMLPCVTDCARRFANDLGFKNLQFRTGLVERIPLPDGAADAAVNEWTGAIWQLDLGHSMLAEMARVVRRGGRIAVTHRLVSLSLFDLHNPWVQFDNIYSSMFGSFAYQDLDIIEEHVWGQKVASLAGERGSSWRKHYMPLVVNPFDVIYASDADPNPKVDIYLTIIAQRR
jgi:SAM-dependent methyltransferase